jgi:redox-sensitive bicupin YhaK (pirin superfamily)
VLRIIGGRAASDGAGVRLTRIIGGPELPQLDPFLLLDEFRSDQPDDYLAGFPDHPHRGFETVTYMLAGRMRHRDSKGNAGLLSAGSVQWMTAGRGIIHSEMPEQEEGLLWGFQLWVNLPAADKMRAPRYQDIAAEQIPECVLPGGAKVRVIAGSMLGTDGPVQAVATEPVYLDIELPPDAAIATPLPVSLSGFVYVFQGAAMIGEGAGARRVDRGELGALDQSPRFVASAGATGARLLLVAGRALNEPIARYGPFVMNTREQIVQAVEDFNAGRF